MNKRFLTHQLRQPILIVVCLVASLMAFSGRAADINGDGQVDVADLVACANMAVGVTPPDLTTADMNADGVVDDLDVVLLREEILGPDDVLRVEVGSAAIGDGGGSVLADDIGVEVPPGAFPATRTVTVNELPEIAPFGDDGGGPMFEISGLQDRGDEVTVRLKTTEPQRALNKIVIGEWNWPKSISRPIWTYRVVEPDEIDGEWAVVTLPLVPTTRDPEPENGDYGIEGDTLRLKLSREIADETGVHFKVHYPKSVTKAQAEDVRLALERGLAAYEGPFKLNTLSRTEWPVDVYLIKGYGNAGVCVDSWWGTNSDYINLKSDDLAKQPDRVRAAASHELMHLIQLMYYSNKNINLWLDEATAVFGELKGSINPDYVGWRYSDNRGNVFTEWHKVAGYIWGYAGKAVEFHGYGMSGIFRYLSGRADTDESIIPTIYTKLAAGTNPMQAIIDSVTAANLATWRRAFFSEFVSGGPCNTEGIFSLMGPGRSLAKTPKFEMLTEKDLTAGIATQAKLKDLDAEIFELAIDSDLLKSESIVRAYLKGANGDLLAFKRAAANSTYLGAGASCGTDEWFIDIPGVQSIMNPFRKIISYDRYRNTLQFVVLNNHTSANFDGSANFDLQFSVSQPYEFVSREFGLPAYSVNPGMVGGYDVICPQVRATGSFSGAFTARIEDWLGIGTMGFRSQEVWVKVAKPLPQTIHLDLNVQSIKNSIRLGLDETVTGTLGKLYMFRYMTWEELDIDNLNSAQVVGPSGINFTLTEQDPIFHGVAYVDVKYEITWGTVIHKFNMLRPIFGIQFYASEEPHIMPPPPTR